MRVSLGSWAFTFGPYASNPVSWEQTWKHAAEAGYDGVEVSGYPPHITSEQYRNTRERRELARTLEDAGLGISGYLADFTSVNPTIEGNKTRYLELFRRYVDLCRDIGSPSIRVDTGSAPGSLTDTEYLRAFEQLPEIFYNAAAYAQTGGVRVAWEFEPGFIFNKPSEVLKLHAAVAHPNFFVLFDTAHAHMCGVLGARQHARKETLKGGVGEFLRLLHGRIGQFHLIDSDGTLHADETSTHRPFGEGVIDFKSLAPQMLAERGVGWWCVDHCFWAGCWDLVGSSLAFVRRLIAGAASA